MLHMRWCREKRTHDGTPLGKCGRLAKAHGMVFQRGPKNLQHIALWRFHAAIDLVAMKAFGLRDDAARATLYGGLKFGVLAGMDADVGNFKNHGLLQCVVWVGRFRSWSGRPMLAGQAPVYAQPMQIQETTAFLAPHPDWLKPDWPAPLSVRALCTTRAGGVSQPPFDGLNLGAYVGDAPQALASNLQRLAKALGARPVMLKQVHGTRLLALEAQTPDYEQADGSYTGHPGLACTVGIADCLPILLCHVAGGQASQVGALHAGWRGLAGFADASTGASLGAPTLDGLSPSSAEKSPAILGVVEAFFASQAAAGRPAGQWLAWLGPCIGPQAFEVGPEVRAAFMAFSPQAAQAFVPLVGGKFLADLPLLARQRLEASGVTAVFGNDGSPAWCTVGNASRFFSYRRDKVTGRQVASICLL